MGRPVRILTLTTCYPLYAGHYNASYVQALCEHLVALGADVTVLAPHAPAVPREEWINGVRVIRFRYLPERWETLCYGGAAIPERLKRSWRYRLMLAPFLLAYLVSAWRVARRTKCQAIHAHWIISLVIGWWLTLGRRIPLEAVCYGVEAFTAQRQPALIRGIVRWVFAGADRIYTISEASRAGLQRLGVEARKVCLYPIGPDPLLMAQRQNGQAEAREGSGAAAVLFVGRLVRRKGVRYLLEAMARVRHEVPQATLTVVGEGPERQSLETYARQLGLNGAVQFVEAPDANALAPWYRRSAVFVLPSIVDATGDTEGLGLVLLEALAFGTPIIGTRVGGIPEIIQDGETGLLVEPGDAEALAQAIVRLLRDSSLAQRLTAHGQRLLESRYSWRLGAQMIYEDTLSRIARQSRSGLALVATKPQPE